MSGKENTRGALWVLFIVVIVLGLFYASHQGARGAPADGSDEPAARPRDAR